MFTLESNFSINLARYDRQFSERRATLAAAYLKQLRALPALKERPIVGKEAIADWFFDMALANREGNKPSWATILRWRKQLDCPILRGRGPKAPVWATNVGLLAWAQSLFHTDAWRSGPRVRREYWKLGSLANRKVRADAYVGDSREGQSTARDPIGCAGHAWLNQHPHAHE